MSAAATPGPWVASVEPKTFATGGYWYVVTDTEENGIGEFYGDDHEANVANLHLAAAAPELYEALTALVFLVDNQPLPEPQRGEAYENAVHDAFEALAKARGEQVQA